MSHILLTGFTPFDGREFNASWIAARALIAAHHSEHILHGLRIPVCWGQPRTLVSQALRQWQPRCVIAMGEGAAGQFKIETRAQNKRSSRKDNAGLLPVQAMIEAQGPAIRQSSAPCAALLAHLSPLGYPLQLSNDAGAYLCEELLYTLEALKEQHRTLQTVLFVHLPPFGSVLELHGQSRQCDSALLLNFSQHLLAGLIALRLV